MTVRPYATVNLVAALTFGFSHAAYDQIDVSEGGVLTNAAPDSSSIVLDTGTLELDFCDEARAGRNLNNY